MPKNSLDWHRDCFHNWASSIRQRRVELDQKLQDLRDSEAGLTMYSEQIAEATRRQLDGFDRDKFLKTRARR